MEVKKYKYSSRQLLVETARLVFFAIILYFSTATDNSVYKSWLLFGVILLLIIGRFIYLLISYYLPCLQNKTALEINAEKIQFFIKAKIPLQTSRELIYWKDVRELDFVSTRLPGAIITFKMNDGSDDSSLPLKYIAGDNRDIFDTMVGYLKK